MNCKVEKILFVEKKKDFCDEANRLLIDLRYFLKIEKLQKLRVINCYIIKNIPTVAINGIFNTPQTDQLYFEKFPLSEDEICIGIRYLKGQYDGRAHWAKECVQILIDDKSFDYEIQTAKIIIINKDIEEENIIKIKKYLINTVECEEFDLQELYKSESHYNVDFQSDEVLEIDNFIIIIKKN